MTYKKLIEDLEKEIERRNLIHRKGAEKLGIEPLGNNGWDDTIELEAKLSALKQARQITLKEVEDLIDKENIYPTDIFPEIHEELLEEINQELQNKFEFPLDRLSAQVCRKILDNQKEALRKL